MAQNVPEFQFSEPALRVRAFLYESWCRDGHAPTLRTVAEATGLSRRELTAAYRELDLGLALTLHHDTQHLTILKMQPFASAPSQVEVHLDGKFHCFAGCAMESVAISRMPPFAGRTLHLESYCPCCLAPVRLDMRDGAVVSVDPSTTLIHVSSTPWDWNRVDIVQMCDSMNYVVDASHAETYEKQVSRRGVLFTLEQARRFVASTGESRMHRYDWPSVSFRPQRVIDGIRALGVDVSSWAG